MKMNRRLAMVIISKSFLLVGVISFIIGLLVDVPVDSAYFIALSMVCFVFFYDSFRSLMEGDY